MKNEKLFNETIDKLVSSYFEGRLEHGSCRTCAVGNIVGNGDWGYHFFTVKKSPIFSGGTPIHILRESNEFTQMRPPNWYLFDFPKSEYSKKQLMDIEWAFETAPKEGDWEFNGLMAVCEVLQRIHECNDETIIDTKKKFIKHESIV